MKRLRCGDQGEPHGRLPSDPRGAARDAPTARIKESCGYEDFAFNAWFEKGGFQSKEIEDQMQYFAEEVKPLLARACGGQVQNPMLGLDFGERH